ncbi:MAG: FHA domain-containing protein [Gammaproteobacteria bacterium]|nr:FHA domain-containing protein [Gammaproteobacteria bacterium]
MKNELGEVLRRMDGRTYILGREGHIYIDSSTASKHHAELRITDGKIHLRDLDSKNGTYLLKNKTLVQFEQGYVNPLQPIVIGGQTYVIRDLIAVAGNFVTFDDAETLLEESNNPFRHRRHG